MDSLPGKPYPPISHMCCAVAAASLTSLFFFSFYSTLAEIRSVCSYLPYEEDLE